MDPSRQGQVTKSSLDSQPRKHWLAAGQPIEASSSPTRLILILGLFGLLICAEWAFMEKISPTARKDPRESSYKEAFLFRMSGYETTSLREGRRVRLRVGSLVVIPRKYLVFNIQPLNEVRFEDFSIEYYRQPGNEAMFPVDDIQQTLLPYGGKASGAPGPFSVRLGAITRGTIRGFTLTVFTDGEARTIIKSEKAEIDFKSKHIRLEDATIEQIDHQRIVKTHHALLKNSAGHVAIPGDYLLSHPGGSVRGKGLRIGL
jgi:hypothetical protein